MEVKAWEYDEYPGLTEEVEGAVHIPTTGDEPGVYHWHDIPYAEVDGHTLVLQILEPYTRNEPEKLHPCFVFVQGSAWGVQDVYKSLSLIHIFFNQRLYRAGRSGACLYTGV